MRRGSPKHQARQERLRESVTAIRHAERFENPLPDKRRERTTATTAHNFPQQAVVVAGIRHLRSGWLEQRGVPKRGEVFVQEGRHATVVGWDTGKVLLRFRMRLEVLITQARRVGQQMMHLDS